MKLFRFSFCVLMFSVWHGLCQAKPNVIFIFSDDHATQAISAYGSKINRTPNIDRIAREGALFEANFCTNSICGPSRASILT
ncbi:MAG: sulfatase-like hydrolase/transferase, partial [Opitutae bacterium]|nr:sulfatase-like hydrolase/transferase [Opitutae bacterium]